MRLCVPLSSVPNWNICVTQLYPKLLSQTVQDPLTHFSRQHSRHQTKLAEEEGIQPSVALVDSRQFSGLVTLATRPLLRARTWSAAADSNHARRVCSSAAHHLLLRRMAPRGGFEHPMAGLESARLTIGNRGVWCARLDSNQHCTAFEAAASAGLDYGRMVGSVGFEPTLDTV
jgi:hypothetical protein